MSKTIFFLQIVLFGCAWSALVLPDREIVTIPSRVEGWINRLPLLNKELGSEIELVFFNPYDGSSFEDVLKAHHSSDAIILRALGQPGGAFYYTDGSGTREISLPVVEMAQKDFDQLFASTQNTTIYANLTFTEPNPFLQFDSSAGWLIMVCFYVILLVGLMILILVKLAQFRFFQDCFKARYNNKNSVIYAVLFINVLSVAIRIINGLNLNDFNLLYHHRLTRVLYTIHIPLFIISHLLWTFWVHRIFEKSKKLEEVTQLLGHLKIPFGALSALLIVLELITLVGTFTFAVSFPYWSIFVLGFYCLCAIGICIFYTVTFYRVIISFRKHSGSAKAKKGARDLTILVAVFDLGIFIWLAMLICQFVPFELAAKRYTGLIGFYGILIDSFALIWSFKPKYKSDMKSNKMTPATEQKTTKTSKSTSSTLSIDVSKEMSD